MMALKKACKRLFVFILITALLMPMANDINLLPIVSATPNYTVTPRHLSIEAEDGTVKGTSLKTESDSSASGGKAIAFTSTADLSTWDNCTETITFTVNVPRDTVYYVWVRFYYGNQWGSFWVDVNGTAGMYNNDNASGWRWTDGVSGQRRSYKLLAGDNTIVVGRRHSVKIDKIVLTTSGIYKPEGLAHVSDGDYAFDYSEDFGTQKYIDYVPAEHPRLLMREEDLPAIKKNLTAETHIEYYQSMLSAVQNPPDGILEEVSTEVDNSNPACLNQLELNALYYLLYRDEDLVSAEKAASQAISGIINYLNTLEYSKHSLGGTSMAMMTPIFVASEIYDWCYPVLTADQKDALIRLCMMHAGNSSIGWPAIQEPAYHNGHSMEQSLMRDIFGFALAVYDEYPEAYYQVSKRIFEEYVPLLNYYYENNEGAHPQGSYYGATLRFEWELWLKWILNTLDQGHLISEKQHNMLYQGAYLRRPDGQLMNDGDDAAAVNSYYWMNPYIPFLGGNLYRDPILRQEVYRSNRNGTTIWYYNHMAHYLILNDPTIGLKGYEALPLSNWGGKLSGVMTARTGWDDGRINNTMIVNMKAPEKFFGGHQHLDAGEFEIYYKGALAIDSGVYGTTSVFASDHDYGYNKQTIAHNCMLIYDESNDATHYTGYPSMGGQVPDVRMKNGMKTQEELEGAATDYGAVLGYDYGDDMNHPEFTYLKGDLTEAYSGKAEKYTRTFLFNNFFDDVYPGCLVVFDKVVTSKNNVQKTWLLHSQQAPDVEGNRTTIVRTEKGYNGRLTNDTLLPQSAKVTTVGGSGKEYLVGSKNYAVSVGDNTESGQYRIEVSPQTNAADGTDYFLNVLQVSDNDDSILPLSSTLLTDIDTHVGVQIKDRILYLSKAEERSKAPITLNISGAEENYLVQIDGLWEGTWKVTGSDYTASKQVTDNGGIINFRVPAGTYTLTYVDDTFTAKDFSVFKHRSQPEKDYVEVRMKDSVVTGNSSEYYDLNAFPQDGTVFAELEHFAASMSAWVTYHEDGTISLSKYGAGGSGNPDGIYHLTFEPGKQEVTRHSKEKEIMYFPVPPYEEKGKVYIPVFATTRVIQKEMQYLPAQNILVIKSTTGYPFEELATHLITVNVTGPGMVNGKRYIMSGEKERDLTFIPDQGCYLKEVTCSNETDLSHLIGSTDSCTGTIGNITSNVEINVVFEKQRPEISNVGGLFQDQDNVYLFGKVIPKEHSNLEYGVVCSSSDTFTDPLYYFPSKTVLNSGGHFGIRLMNPYPLLGKQFYMKLYIKYLDGEQKPVYLFNDTCITVGKEKTE